MQINFVGQLIDSDGIKPDPRTLQAFYMIKLSSNISKTL